MLPTEVGRFSLRVLAFGFPLFLLVAIFELGLWRSGEAYPASWVVSAQERDADVIYLRGLMDQQFGGFKSEALRQRHPRVLCVGTSRVMQITASMFASNERFYNFGGGVQSVADLAAFVDHLTDAPEVVIIGIDPWWFNPEVPNVEFFVEQLGAAKPLAALTDWRGQLSAIRTLIRDPRLVKATLLGGRYPTNLGLAAQMKDEGFRSDGSYRYEAARTSDWHFIDREDPPVFERIETGTKQFVPATTISEQRLASFRTSMQALHRRGVFVIGFLPTMSTQAFALLEHAPSQATLWHSYRTRLAEMFGELSLPFIDATSPDSIGVDDRYMLDGMHGMQTLQLHLLQRLLSDPRVDAALPGSRAVVERALNDPRTDFWTPHFLAP